MGLIKAADYDLSFKFYELTGSALDFVEDVYKKGGAVPIDYLNLRPGQEFALAVYEENISNLAEGFNIDVLWDDSVLEPWTINLEDEIYTYATVDFNSIYPGYYDRINKEPKSYWSDNNFSDVNYYKTVDGKQIPSVTANFSTSHGKDGRLVNDGVLFWLFFKVKETVTSGTNFNFTVSPKSTFVSDGRETTISFSIEYANCLVVDNNSERYK